jgi:hypothetical protein
VSIPAEVRRGVERRAAGRCEYCRMHQALQGATFHVEHVVPTSRGGLSVPSNLAWSCPGCNLHKADRVHASDPETGRVVQLFNPRQDPWSDHFRWDDTLVVALTAVGRATLATLRLNQPRRLQIRQAEALFRLFPPPD